MEGSSQLWWLCQWLQRSSFLPNNCLHKMQLYPALDQNSIFFFGVPNPTFCISLEASVPPDWVGTLLGKILTLFWWWKCICLFGFGTEHCSSWRGLHLAKRLLSLCCFHTWVVCMTTSLFVPLLPCKSPSFTLPWISSPWQHNKWNLISPKDSAINWHRPHLTCNFTPPGLWNRSSKLHLLPLLKKKEIQTI